MGYVDGDRRWDTGGNTKQAVLWLHVQAQFKFKLKHLGLKPVVFVLFFFNQHDGHDKTVQFSKLNECTTLDTYNNTYLKISAVYYFLQI